MIRKFDFLVALYIFGVVVAETMGSKTFPLATIGGFHATAGVAIFVMPLLFTTADVIVEVYGKKRARSVVLSGLIMVFLLMLFSILAVHLPATPRYASTEPAYNAIFGASARLAFASIMAFAGSELLDIAIFNKLRQSMNGRALWLRNNVANFVSQFADSAIFLTLAFYALKMSFGSNVSFLLGLIIPYWLVRCALSVLETPLVYAGVWWLKGESTRAVTAAKAAA
ncbi:MAG TPA: queuosine precursor transporter [Candidatus Saccharimonadales bacterium]|jgi:hypothetical protein